ncbi:exonuclease V [Daedaleopsis nitida]|nr:exonuclease V [Daedaleopsis nitida]
MSQSDEFDSYYDPIDPEELAAIDAATARALLNQEVPDLESSHLVAHSPPPHHADPELLSPPSPDEYDAYDFSEFTAEDFAHIDAMVRAATPAPAETLAPPEPVTVFAVHTSPEGSRPNSGAPGRGCTTDVDAGVAGNLGREAAKGRVASGGPQIPIAVERATHANRSRYLKDIKAYPPRSPYDQFRSWNRLLSVTDLTGPSWCEVQFDYGLRQKRYKKLGDRPDSFVSAEGKTITVSHAVAAVNHRTVTRGRSVHKALEQEIQPEAVHVDITTAEERWALRIINMLNALQTLTEQGCCREMPVFGIVHNQLVTGIIDEIVREPLPASERPATPEIRPSRSSPNKRSAPRSTPSTPSSSKKSRNEGHANQPQITTFFSPSVAPVHPDEVNTQQTLELPRYRLQLSDTKTRTRPSLPPDEDTFASRIQLMLYHRLLSNLLAVGDPSIASSSPLDFDLLWKRAGVNPSRKFSDGFLHQTGLSSASEHDPSVVDMSCLNDLTQAWRHAAAALAVAEVDNTLTLVYRLQPAKPRVQRKAKANGKGKGRDRTQALSEQEAQHVAAAIQASISDVRPGQGGDDDLARAIFESLKDSLQSGAVADGELGVLTHPFGPPIDSHGSAHEPVQDAVAGSLSADPQLAWALQQSLLPRLEETAALKGAIAEPTDLAEAAGVDDVSRGPKLGPEHATGAVTASADACADADVDVPMAAPAAGGDESTDDEITAAELETEAKILGRKTFEMDDAVLDGYLARVLAWWYGRRPAEGVDVELTRRCVTCEYRDGCEWREKKADEALTRHRERTRSAGDGGSSSSSADVDVWI